MSEVFVLPLPEPQERVFSGLTLEVLAELPVKVLERVVRGYGRLAFVRNQVVIQPDNEDSAKWITTTLNYLGIPVAYWPEAATEPRGTE